MAPERPTAAVATPPSRPPVRAEEPEARRAEPRPVRGGGKRARAALTLIGLSAMVGALVAVGTAAAIYLIVLAIQSALS
ncbi:MAG TPA: hypothetical protein VMY88_09315 [Acidimicrobiales bacterium]|nr:hypothetical protein [Acidimicrobiales bacterium]